MAKYLVTGGAGFIGSNLARFILDKGHQVVILDNLATGKRENITEIMPRITFIEGDIRDRKLLAELMQGVDVLFHQAAIRITQCAEEPRLALEVLADGSFNVFEAAVKGRVKRVVAASSASVYGLADEFPTPEKHHP